MTLPAPLADAFVHKQKSYKMVLILAMLDVIEELKRPEVPITRVRTQFLKLLQRREAEGLPVDPPPERVGDRWSEVSGYQIGSLMQTLIRALSDILVHDTGKQTLRFTDELRAQ